MSFKWQKSFWLVVSIAIVTATSCGQAPERTASDPIGNSPPPRPMTEWVAKCSPTAVDIQIVDEKKRIAYWGSGTIIHNAGYILTCNHVTTTGDRYTAQLGNMDEYDFRKVATMYEYDLAVLKIDRDEPFQAAALARNKDVTLGQPVLVIGNPSGQFHTVSPGIVSGLHRGENHFFQTNAAINRGNSGGPVYNQLGELMGVVQIKKPNMENVSYAIPIARVRRAFADVLLDERRTGLRTGLSVAESAHAEVTKVNPGSPADEAGVKAGDIIRKAGNLRVEDGVHYCLALTQLKPGDKLPLEVERNGEVMSLVITLGQVPLQEAVKLDTGTLAQGVQCSEYTGKWEKLPDFDSLEPVSSKVVPAFGLSVSEGRKDLFGLKFTGYIDAPAQGLYTFYTSSDDGSRLWIGEELVVDNDGLHPTVEKPGYVRLKAGKHPIKVTFFEASGDEALTVLYEGPKIKKQEIPTSVLFTLKR